MVWRHVISGFIYIYSDFLGYLCCYFGELGMMDPPGNDHIFVGSTHPHPVTGSYYSNRIAILAEVDLTNISHLAGISGKAIDSKGVTFIGFSEPPWRKKNFPYGRMTHQYIQICRGLQEMHPQDDL